MAIDTALKRLSAINHGSPWRGLLPIPDGSIGQADRQVVPYLYSGILATTQVLVSCYRIYSPLTLPYVISSSLETGYNLVTSLDKDFVISSPLGCD